MMAAGPRSGDSAGGEPAKLKDEARFLRLPDVSALPDAAPTRLTLDGGLEPLAPEQWQQLYAVRTFREGDSEACVRLYRDGLLGGQIAGNDTGLDIDDIAGAYLADPLNHFWVAEVTPAAADERFAAYLAPGDTPGTVVGMIGVQHYDENVGEIRRLRVDATHRRRRIGSRLLETAVKFCRDTGSIKVQLDTYIQRDAALQLFDRFRFRHGRTRQVRGKDMLYFYLDLYRGPGDADPA